MLRDPKTSKAIEPPHIVAALRPIEQRPALETAHRVSASECRKCFNTPL
ncbi:phage integrase central domain-containing protein [Bradyrhizobium sp. USDA 4529]